MGAALKKMQLMVRPDNSQVQAFYWSLGYVDPMAQRPRTNPVIRFEPWASRRAI